jgi:(E)-4-hydroxy-3-methylbut-2-enyl-diphosphate synthase
MGRSTRPVKVRDLTIGSGAPISVQTMCSTPTRDTDATLRQVRMLHDKGADLIRLAVDNHSDLESLKIIRKNTSARLAVDLQENYSLAAKIAPYVDKIRYNPGHLYHLEKDRTIEQKVLGFAALAKEHRIALRIGVNCGSVDPVFLKKYPGDKVKAIVENAVWHCGLLEEAHFANFVVSLKDSDPQTVVACNRVFARRRPDIPLHLGVTEAGLVPEGVIKTRLAFEQLIPFDIGDTLRVSLTLLSADKAEEIQWGRRILKDIEEGRFVSAPKMSKGLNIISCPSCSRVENEDFIKLAMKVKEATAYAKDQPLTVAVMGCRVNGPGETDSADLGLWCGPTAVTLKKKSQVIGAFGYERVLPALLEELNKLIGTP